MKLPAFIKTSFFLLSILLAPAFITTACTSYKTMTGEPVYNAPYLTWQDNPSTTMVINYQSAARPNAPAVLYDTVSEPETYRYRSSGVSGQIPGIPDGRFINSVFLDDLTPGVTYYFRFGNEEEGLSAEYSFRTVPEDDAPIRFVSGGDTRITFITKDLFVHAAAQDPLFVVIGGDLSYADGDMEKLGRWDAWFQHWHDYMVTPDGHLIPMVLGIGNHEVNKSEGSKTERAPFFFGFFPQGGASYFSRPIGKHLGMIVLDSGHLVDHATQADWLESELQRYEAYSFCAAVYHVPLYPSHRDFDGAYSSAGRSHWLPLFDAFDLSVGFEHHDHTFKRTKRLRNNAVDASGAVYVGDGNMGVRPRRPKRGLWYMEKVATTSHFWVVDVTQEQMTLRAMDGRGVVFDETLVYAR